MSPPEAAPVPARIAVALATAASVWCLQSAQLLSVKAAVLVVALLLTAETCAAMWPVPARRLAFPVALALFGVIALVRVREIAVTSVSSARPLGAFLTAGAMVALSLAGARRRDAFARIGLLMSATGLALTAGSTDAVAPAIAVGIAVGAAMVALERAVLTSASTAAHSRRPPPPLARTRMIAVPLAATVALTAFAAANVTLPKHRQHTAFDTPGAFSGSSGGTSSAQTRLDPRSDVMDLRQRGKLSDQPVAKIQPLGSDQGPQLWRAAVMDGYDGATWSVAQNADPVAADGDEQVDQVTPVGAYQLPLLTPGTAFRLETANSSVVDPPFPETVGGDGYQVTSVVPFPGPATIDQVPKGATAADEQNVQAPHVPARVVALGRQLTAGATTRTEAVDAVVAYLHSHETYKLDSPVPAKGTDAVDDFLFHSHTGFCEQFASAAAILLQASGVPTRVVTGYASGERQADGSFLLRGSDAHAWIEVQYPGTGWLPVDPTAGVRLAPSKSGWHWQPLAIALAVLLFCCLIAVGIMAVRRRRSLRADPIRHSLVMLDAALGSERRRPNESLRDLSARLALSPDERGAVHTVERVFYGAGPVDTSEVVAAATTLRRTARRVRRERIIPRRRQVRS